MGVKLIGRYIPGGKIKFRSPEAGPPRFLSQPSISPESGPMGTTFTGQTGTISNATFVVQQWLLNGVEINGQTSETYVSDGIGELTFRVRATGTNGFVEATSLPVTISAPTAVQNAPEFFTSPGLLGTFPEQTSISIPIQATDTENNISTWTVVSGELPPGVTLNMFNGTISGQLGEVTADKTFTFKIKVTDRTNLSVEGQFSINVANVKTTVNWETGNEEALAMPAPGEPIKIQLGASSI